MAQPVTVTVNILTVSLPVAMTREQLRHVIQRLRDETHDLSIRSREGMTLDDVRIAGERIEACRAFVAQLDFGAGD